MIINFKNLGGGGGGEYVLPVATASRLGGVKVGSGLAITSDGVLSSNGGAGKNTWKLTYDGSAVYGATGLYAKIASYSGKSDFFNEQEVILTDSVDANTFVFDSLTDVDTHYMFEGSAGTNKRAVLFVSDAMVAVEYMELADTSALDAKQDVLTAGEGISIEDNVISATGGAGGDYKIVDELPEDAEDGTMVYLTADQDVVETFAVESGKQYTITETMGSYHSLYSVSAYNNFGTRTRDNWNEIEIHYPGGSKVFLPDASGIFPGDGYDPGYVYAYIGSIFKIGVYNVPECRYEYTITDEDGSGVDIDSIEVITNTYKVGLYLRENGEWIEKKDVPSLVYNSGAGILTDEQKADFDAVGAAYKAGEPYHLFVDKRPCIIDMYDEGNAEIWYGSVNTNYNGNVVKCTGGIVRRNDYPGGYTRENHFVEKTQTGAKVKYAMDITTPSGEGPVNSNIAEKDGYGLFYGEYWGEVCFGGNWGEGPTLNENLQFWRNENAGVTCWGQKTGDHQFTLGLTGDDIIGDYVRSDWESYVGSYYYYDLVLADKYSLGTSPIRSIDLDYAVIDGKVVDKNSFGIPKVGSGELPDLETAADGGDVVAETYRAGGEGEWLETGNDIGSCEQIPGETYYEYDWDGTPDYPVDSVIVDFNENFNDNWHMEAMPSYPLIICVKGELYFNFYTYEGQLYCEQDGYCDGYEPVSVTADYNNGPVSVEVTTRDMCDDPATEFTRSFAIEYVEDGGTRKVKITGLNSAESYIVSFNSREYNWVEAEGEMMLDGLRVANKHTNDWDEVQRNWDYIPTSAHIKNIKFVSQSEYDMLPHDFNTLYLTWNDQA